MPVACLYDIHGNLPALEAVLEEVKRSEADHIVVGGDVLPYFHDAMRWNAAQLTRHYAEKIAQWPLVRRLHVGGIGDVVFCHATTRNDSEIFTRQTSDATLTEIFEPLKAHAVVCGHTHMQHQRTVGTTRIINAGSIGASFQGAGAYWLLLGPTVQLRRT